MRVGLMIPCYVDVFYPEVGIATLELLEKLGIEVDYPFDQTCCGQPMANSGCESDARATEELFIRNFSTFEYIVIPSGSCTHHIRNKFIARLRVQSGITSGRTSMIWWNFFTTCSKQRSFPGPPSRIRSHSTRAVRRFVACSCNR